VFYRCLLLIADTLSLLPEVEKLNGLVLQRTTHSHSSSASSASAVAGEDENDMEEYVDIRIDPEQYRKVEEIVQELTKGTPLRRCDVM